MPDKPRLIDADKLIKQLQDNRDLFAEDKFGSPSYNMGRVDSYHTMITWINNGHFDPDPPQHPDIQPGDRVNYIGTQFPFLKNVKVNHIEIHRVGRVAALAYDDEIYKVYVDQLQKVEGEEV
ncbi:hypothetical protein J2W97_002243 [Paenibacillus jamilae]|jgi:hypothetical protein|uniref:hypothetical protein n=1 Tax=Paenibacillus polymyxa TaxID=1406 RepID=UPI00158125D5|nr:hypothetical protein [Paenibacillus polymyxa]MDP9676248.1 hypothetical protein [Paenibacillus jamilae]MBY0020756.1 hypothetical protein [Paenibacillus polymyxa]MBY0059060.1 hypothetical protein [Paenibacillus polymyxa]MBY0069647.1 hypothetical protein [Paenibacillus polymyxa]MBY0083264.1 hypothetical protein [Paenibacillus polymyxa]